jgi:hypothetical protein
MNKRPIPLRPTYAEAARIERSAICLSATTNNDAASGSCESHDC